MLRAWQDRFFIKIAGEEDSKEFRDFATQVARHFAEAIGSRGPLPGLISFLPEKVLRPSQIRYLHTDADLNTAHYVSTDNVLQLAKGRTDVVFADGSLRGKPLKVAVVRYRAPADRAKALAAFSKTILSRRAKSGKEGMRFEEMRKNQFTGVRPFAGRQGEPMLALCFEAKTAALCQEALTAVANSQTGSGSG